MGLSKSKTKTTNDPSQFAKPYVTSGADALQGAYGQTSGLASSISQNLGSHLGQLSDDAFTPSAGVTAATDYNTGVLNGDYLSGNQYLDGMVKTAGNDITDRISATFGAAGRTGSGANQYALTKGLGESENALRYGAYNDERTRMGQAASLAPSLDSARYNGLGAYLTAAQTAVGMPMDAASQYSNGLAGLLGKYQTGTQTSSPSLGAILAQIAGNTSVAIRSGAGGA